MSLRGFADHALREKNMLGRLNHVAIATKDAVKSARIYGAAFGARGFVRLNFCCSRDTLEVGLERIKEACAEVRSNL